METNERQKTYNCDKNVKNSKEAEDGTARLTIFDLPNEIIVKIFSYLESNCLLLTISFVCKAWKALAEDQSLWKSLDLCWNKRTDLTKILFKFKFIQDLSLSECTKFGSCSLRALSQLSALKYLELENCIIPRLRIGNLDKLSLTSLKFSRIETSNQIFDIIDLQLLKNLDFRYCNFVGKSPVVCLKKCTELKHLRFHNVKHSYAYIFDKQIDSLIQALSGNLVSLTIIGPHRERAIANLNKCSKLSRLHIEIFEVSDITLFQIMNKRLEALVLNPISALTSEMVHRVFTEGGMSNLTHLDLKYCIELNDSNLFAIANYCKMLSILNLYFNDIVTDVGVSAIVNKCPKIVELCFIHFEKLKGTFLSEIIEENLLEHLIKVDLTGLEDKKYLVALKAARPNVQIVYNTSHCQ